MIQRDVHSLFGYPGSAWVAGTEPSRKLLQLRQIIERDQLQAVFQPIIRMRFGEIFGFEGLVRGPSDSSLHVPVDLFTAAAEHGLEREIERLSQAATARSFAKLGLPGKLFINVSPGLLVHPNTVPNSTLEYLNCIGISSDRIVIELTENQRTHDFASMREALLYYRNLGFQVAIDDLGEGFSSLRLWSELKPEFVKIDMHFIRGLNRDPLKLQFVKAIQQIADCCGTQVIAEGIETEAEFRIVKDLGITYGQGYFIARPHPRPSTTLDHAVRQAIEFDGISVYPEPSLIAGNSVTAHKLLISIEPVFPDTDNEAVYMRLAADAELHALPVVKDGSPIGLINRQCLIDRFARLYYRELYAKKPCTTFMDATPLIVDKNMSVHELSAAMVGSERKYLADGFIITDQGRYLGMGTGQDLVREITRIQIAAARYANPLTLLPGNVPIYEHIDRLLESRVQFVAGYFDLNHFKPFNDMYGYDKGDDVIKLTGHILTSISNGERDFVGHIGGDDFIVLFQSPDWEARCQTALRHFDAAINEIVGSEHRERGGYYCEDRRGERVFQPIPSLSIGAVKIDPDVFASHHEVSTAVTEAKRQAKRTPGNNLFIERRQYQGANTPPADTCTSYPNLPVI